MSTHTQNKAQDQDLIGLWSIVKQSPHLLRKLPRVLQGLYHANKTRPQVHMGLAWGFEKAVRKNPTGVALWFEAREWTYNQLNQWANQIAHHFARQGLVKGDKVALMIDNRPELIACVLALAKLGVTAALINTAQRAHVLVHSINLAHAKALVIGEEVRAYVEAVRDELTVPAHQYYWCADGYAPSEDNNTRTPEQYHNLHDCSHSLSKDNLAQTQHVYGEDALFYIYTSGTTGLPKAVKFTNQRWMRGYGNYGHILDLNRDDVMFVTLPFYHATAIVVAWSGVITGTATLALNRKFSASNFLNQLNACRATAFVYVGELCRYILDTPASSNDRAHKVTKIIGNGMRPNIWRPFKQRFGIKEILEFYASSEGNVGFFNIFNFDCTAGFTNLGYEVVQYDKETDQPVRDTHGHMISVPTGGSGLLLAEITKRSPFDGYTDQGSTDKVVWRNVFKPGDAYFNTGDMVRQIGYKHVQFVDRLGDTFRWKGENVSTNQVENTLSDAPKVAEAIGYGVEIPNTNGRAGMAVLIPEAHQTIDADDLNRILKHAQNTLPHYAVPVFVRIQHQFEVTSTFKYNKNTLKSEGFDITKTQDPVYVCLPKSDHYQRIDAELYQRIVSGQYRF